MLPEERTAFVVTRSGVVGICAIIKIVLLELYSRNILISFQCLIAFFISNEDLTSLPTSTTYKIGRGGIIVI